MKTLEPWKVTDPLRTPLLFRLRLYRQYWKGNLAGFVAWTFHRHTPRLP